MENFFSSTLPGIINTYANYRIARDTQKAQITAQQAAQTAYYQQQTQQPNIVPVLLVGAGVLAFIAFSRK